MTEKLPCFSGTKNKSVFHQELDISIPMADKRFDM